MEENKPPDRQLVCQQGLNPVAGRATGVATVAIQSGQSRIIQSGQSRIVIAVLRVSCQLIFVEYFYSIFAVSIPNFCIILLSILAL